VQRDSSSYVLRLARPDDALPLLDLFQDTIRRVNCRDYCPDQIAAWTSGILPEVWAARLASRWCVVAQMHDNRLGGFADLEVDDLKAGDLKAGGHLDRFYVSADFQRIGIGRALLAAVMQRAAVLQLPRVFTEVSITARPFFLSQGFRVITDQLVFSRGAAFLNYRMEADVNRILSAKNRVTVIE
jgi:putative acetyltransferase